MNDDVAAVKEAGESNVDAADGDGGGIGTRKLEEALREERGKRVTVGEQAEVREGEAVRDDVETERFGVSGGGLSHVEGEEGSVGGSEEGEGAWGVVWENVHL